MCKCNRPLCNECQGFEKAHEGPKGPTPHKHAALIKAWADGAKVEWKNAQGTWVFIASPMWYGNDVYRVKPPPKPLWETAKDAFFKDEYNNNVTSTMMWENVATAVVAAYKEQQNAN